MTTHLNQTDRIRVTLLIIAIVLVFGFAAWRVQTVLSSAERGGPALSQVSPTPGQSNLAAPAPEQTSALIVPPANPGVNPFRSTVTTPAPTPTPAPASQNSRSSGPAAPIQAPPAMLGGNIPVTLSPTKVEGASAAASAPTQATPSFRLVGSLSGDHPVAIIANGQKEFVVQVGDRLDTGETVVQITADQVVLKLRGATTTIRPE